MSGCILFKVAVEAMCSCFIAAIMCTLEICGEAPDRMTASIDLFWRDSGASSFTKKTHVVAASDGIAFMK